MAYCLQALFMYDFIYVLSFETLCDFMFSTSYVTGYQYTSVVLLYIVNVFTGSTILQTLRTLKEHLQNEIKLHVILRIF